MALEGSLKDFGLADILQLIYFQRKTGVLTLEGRLDRVRLLFVDGSVVAAESKRRAEDSRLGKVLVKRGILSEDDLRSALEDQRTTGTKLGGVLIRKGFVSQEVIHDILNVQVTETVVQLFGWKQGTYEFSAQGVPVDKDLQFTLDTQHLLMEGLRIVDELSVIRDRIRLDALFRKKAAFPEELSIEEQEVLSHVDGESDVSTIVDITGRDNFEVSKVLLSLVEKGAIEEIGVAPVPAASNVSARREAGRSFGYLPYAAVVISFLLSFLSVAVHRGDTAKTAAASKQVAELRFRAEAYRIERGVYPSDLSALGAGADPWGRPFVYRREDVSLLIASPGPDGRDGTADDVY